MFKSKIPPQERIKDPTEKELAALRTRPPEGALLALVEFAGLSDGALAALRRQFGDFTHIRQVVLISPAIWCAGLVAARVQGSFAGMWKKGLRTIGTISEDNSTLTQDGEVFDIRIEGDKITFDKFTGRLEGSRIFWNHGSVWERGQVAAGSGREQARPLDVEELKQAMCLRRSCRLLVGLKPDESLMPCSEQGVPLACDSKTVPSSRLERCDTLACFPKLTEALEACLWFWKRRRTGTGNMLPIIGEEREVWIWELQRRTTLFTENWRAPFLPHDGFKRWRWVDTAYQKHPWMVSTLEVCAASKRPPLKAPLGWEELKDHGWEVIEPPAGSSDVDYWQYGVDFYLIERHWGSSRSLCHCRRRLWKCTFVRTFD